MKPVVVDDDLIFLFDVVLAESSILCEVDIGARVGWSLESKGLLEAHGKILQVVNAFKVEGLVQ